MSMFSKSGIDKRIEFLNEEIVKPDLQSEVRANYISELDSLYGLKNKMSEREIDKTEILKAAVSIGSILLIMNYEKTDIIATKAFTFATRMIGK